MESVLVMNNVFFYQSFTFREFYGSECLEPLATGRMQGKEFSYGDHRRSVVDARTDLWCNYWESQEIIVFSKECAFDASES